MGFASTYRSYIRSARKSDLDFGFDLRSLAKLEPFLQFLYEKWWRVNFVGLEKIPAKGPALIVGNNNGLMPWIPLMLTYALMGTKGNPRRVHIVADMDWINDEHVYLRLQELGFVPWSSANLKYLFSKGQIAAVFPEGASAVRKPFSERYRLCEFDWTRILPAIEENITIFPLATVGLDEAIPTIANVEGLAQILGLPGYPVSPFMPLLPFPANLLASLPVEWRMKLIKPTPYEIGTNRDSIEETAKHQSRFIEGEIQAEVNRILRLRNKSQGSTNSHF